jgi:hypothetical protein
MRIVSQPRSMATPLHDQAREVAVTVSYRKRMETGGTGCELTTPNGLKLLLKIPQPQTRRIRRVNRRPREG